MSNFGTLLKLDLKSRFGGKLKFDRSNVLKWISNIIITSIIYVILVGLLVYVTKNVYRQWHLKLSLPSNYHSLRYVYATYYLHFNADKSLVF